MKLRKSKIAAAAMAAVTAISAAQAITASAFSYTTVPQRTCESYSYVNNITTYLSGCNGTKANTTWSGSVTWGPTCKTGFQGGSYSNIGEGTSVSSGKAFARKVAKEVYGTTSYMEMKEVTNTNAYNYFKYIPRIGDQVTVKYGSTEKTIFITKVTNGTIKACEVDEGGKIRYNKSYTYRSSNKTFTYSGKAWTFQYVARPVKEGDANGDSYVSLSGDSFSYTSASGSFTFNCKADGAEMSYIYDHGCRSGEQYNWLCAAADLAPDWQIDGRDYKVLTDRMREGNQISHDGCMPNGTYVLFPW